MEKNMDMLLCDNVSFIYTGGGRALTGINLRCAEGGYTLVTGPSGAGKSTLFRLLVRLEEPASGTDFLSGRPRLRVSPDRAAPPHHVDAADSGPVSRHGA